MREQSRIKPAMLIFLMFMSNENFRKQGVGQAMIKFILNHPKLKDVYQWLLITKDAHGVYSKAWIQATGKPGKMDGNTQSRTEEVNEVNHEGN